MPDFMRIFKIEIGKIREDRLFQNSRMHKKQPSFFTAFYLQEEILRDRMSLPYQRASIL